MQVLLCGTMENNMHLSPHQIHTTKVSMTNILQVPISLSLKQLNLQQWLKASQMLVLA